MKTGYEYKSELARTYYREGQAEGEARALVRVLRKRGLEVSDALASRIMAQTDPDQLDVWLDRALTATSIDEVFADRIS